MDLKIKYISSVLFFLILFYPSRSQNKTEEDVKENAEDLFSNQQYGAALQLYSQLLSLYPKDPDYSYRFGACKLFTEKDKEGPLTYLEYGAANANVEPEAFFFLAKGYHLNYRFDEALINYKKFDEKGDPKSKEKLQINRHISMCENGQKLLKNITDIVVLDKKKLSTSDFFRNYNLSDFGGKIIKTPDEFKLPFDIKHGKESIMYLQPNAETVYFSSYGEDGTNGKDIYFSKKTPDGNWGKPQKLKGPVNTGFDEDYAFFHPNGILYFASTGHNSMGGYDIFRSTFDEESQEWSYPQNIDFAINTPGDDYLYITDMEEKNAYFSSNRESSDQEVTVYRVKVDRIPVDIALIKGNFIASATKSAKITIEDLKDGKIAGVYNTNSNTGDYVLTVPNGGKFKFIVETSESPVTYSGMVDIPRQKTLKTLKQEMQLLAENGEQRLIIKNKFDEEDTAQVSVLLAEIFKEKAFLEVNADEIQEDTSSSEKVQPPDEVKTTISSGESAAATEKSSAAKSDISNDQIIQIAKEDAKALQKEASDLKVEKEIAYSIATEKNRLSNAKAAEADEMMNKATGSPDPKEKQDQLEKARQFKKESKLYAEQAVAAFNLAREIEKLADEKQKEADISFNYAQELENAIQQNSPEATAEKLSQLSQFQEKQKSQPAEGSGYSDMQKQIEEKRKETEIQTKLADKLAEDVKNLQADVTTLQNAARAEKKKKEKERLEEQAAILERDLPAMQSEAFTAKEMAEKSHKELLRLEKQETILSSVVNELKSSDKTSVVNLNETDRSKLEMEISGSEERIAKIDQELASDTDKTEEPLVSIIKTTENKDTALQNVATENIVADIENQFKSKVESSEKQADPLVKEESKAKDYEEWAKALEKEALSLKEKSSLAGDENEKNAILQKATALEKAASEKRQLSSQSIAAAEQLRTIAGNDTTSKTTSGDYNTYYQQKLANDEVQTDKIAKEQSKAANLESWAKAMEDEASELKLKAETATDETEKASLTEKAVTLENSAKEKRTLAHESKTLAEQMTTGKTSTETSSATESVPADYDNYYKQKIESNETQTDIVKKEESKARDLNAWATALEKEAAAIKQQAEASTDETEKAALNEKAQNLERSAIEKQEQSRESQATAAQLRLGSTTVESSGSNSQSLASYSEKFITAEKNAMEIQNEKDKAITLAEINKEWGNEISKEISLVQASGDTITNQENKAENAETLRLLEDLKKEKETRAQQYTEKALEATVSTITATTSVDEKNIPAEYSPWFEEKLKEQEALTDPVAKEESKAAYFEAWAKSTDKEIQQLKSQSDTTIAEEEKRGLEEKIATLEMQSKERTELSGQSREQAKLLSVQVTKDSAKTAMEEQPTSSGENITIEEAKVQQMRIGEKKYQMESYNNMMKAIDTSMENSKSMRETGDLENQKKDLQARMDVLNTEIQKEENTVSVTEEENPAEKISREKMVESESAKKESDSLQSEALVMNYQADKMGFFKRKKREELRAKAKTAEKESQLKKLDSDFANETAITYTKAKKESSEAIKNSSPLPSEIHGKKSKSAEDEAAYISDQANAVRQSALAVKKKKVKKKINAEADSLDHEAAMKRKEAQHNAILAQELKKIEKEAFADAFAEAEKNESKLSLFDVELSEEDIAGMKDNSEQQQFAAIRKTYRKLYLEAEVTNEGSAKMKKDANEKLNQFAAMVAGIDTIPDENVRKQLTKDAMDFLDQTKKDISTSDSIAYVALVKEESARTKAREAILPLLDGDKEILKKIIAFQYYKPPVDSSQLIASVDTTPEDTVVQMAIPIVEETFTLSSNAPVYNEKNPIPLNPKYPDGLIWQVQIGAFRNPIPQDLFKGFAPIMGVRVSDGITRFSAGMFKSFSNANSAKNEIVKLGYKDAFVVVYKDGQRVSIPEARKLIAQGLFQTDGITDISVTPEKTIASSDNSTASAAGENVSSIEGLFFTVQIGVYSKPASSLQLFNVQPVNSEKLSNGTIRYSSGVYSDITLAGEAKNKIVEKGIKDAFVCAYFNGKRISIAEAKKMTGGVQPGSENPLGAKKETRKPGVTDAEFGITESEDGIIFRVQLGSFGGEVPVKQAGAILEFTRKNSKQKTDDNGNTVYLAGIFREFASAEKLKIKATGSGLADAVIVAFKNGLPIALDEAKKEIGGGQ